MNIQQKKAVDILKSIDWFAAELGDLSIEELEEIKNDEEVPDCVKGFVAGYIDGKKKVLESLKQ